MLDRNGENARRYNALWLPRAYALDEQGNVAYVQPDTTQDPQAPLHVAALWGQETRPLAPLLPASAPLGLAAPLSPAVLLAGTPGPSAGIRHSREGGER